MPRFFIDRDLSGQQFFTLEGQQAAHAKVLRLSRGETVTVSDASAKEYTCTVSDISSTQICLVVQKESVSDAEPAVPVTVYMAFAKGDKLEHVIQKATELGASAIVAFPSSRCVAKYDAALLKKKLPRWQRIAESAAEQSGRGRIPAVSTADSYAQALSMAAEAELPLFFYENEHARTLTAALSQPYHSVSIVTGPEGGFSTLEAEQAEAAGLQVCTLGKRILRCETAPLCALSAVMYASGEF